jgi:Zn-dependent protease with chaperone function
MDIKIKGLEKSDTRYAILKRNIETISASYNMKDIKIDVNVIQKGTYPDAQTTLLGNSLRIPVIVLDLTEDELKPILAHEFSHLSNRDNIVQGLIVSIFVVLPLIVIYYLSFPYFFEKICMFLSISLIFFLLILGCGFKIMNWVSIKQEIRADRDALLKNRNKEAMLNAISKLRNHAGEKRPSFLKRAYQYFCGYSHQSWKERIELIKNFDAKMTIA